jgi:hypothetical protein
MSLRNDRIREICFVPCARMVDKLAAGPARYLMDPVALTLMNRAISADAAQRLSSHAPVWRAA